MSNLKRKNKKILLLMLTLIFLMSIFGACSADEPKDGGDADVIAPAPVEISISAAASLTESLNEIAKLYAKESEDTLLFNFAGSGALVKQIEEGAPCDLFISASKKDMDTLDTAKLIDTTTRKDLLGNALTLVAAQEKVDVIKSTDDINGDKVESIAVGTPETVPAGRYAKEYFESAGTWETIQPKLVFTKDVKQVLEYVETGNADCGFVYKSDAMTMKTGKIVLDLPEDTHSPIVYPAAVTAEATQPEAAKAFYEFIQSDAAKSVFEKYGFAVV